MATVAAEAEYLHEEGWPRGAFSFAANSAANPVNAGCHWLRQCRRGQARRSHLQPRQPVHTITRYSDVADTSLVASSAYGYDGAGRLTSLVAAHSRNSTTIADYDWTYDVVNRITAFTNSVHPSEDTTYSYDDTDQLTGADRTGTTSDETYNYDDNGNRTNTGYSTGTNNQLLSDGTFNYTYEDEGNTLTRTRVSSAAADDYLVEYKWDHRNRLTGVTFKNNSGVVTKDVDNDYDAFNRWIGKTVDPDGAGSALTEVTNFIYDGTQIVMEFDGSGGADLSHRLLWGPAVDQIFADEDIVEGLRWTYTDHLNTVRDVGDSSGNVLNHIHYDGFGQVLSQTDSTIQLLIGFTGRPFDQDTGLQNNWHRWYVAHAGLWLSPDPIGFAGGDTNLARYSGNNAVARTDPSGLASPIGHVANLAAQVSNAAAQHQAALASAAAASRALQQALCNPRNAQAI